MQRTSSPALLLDQSTAWWGSDSWDGFAGFSRLPDCPEVTGVMSGPTAKTLPTIRTLRSKWLQVRPLKKYFAEIASSSIGGEIGD